MRFNFLPGTFAIVTLLSACGGHHAPDVVLPDDASEQDAAGPISEAKGNSGAPEGDVLEHSKSDGDTAHEDDASGGASASSSEHAGSAGSSGAVSSGGSAGFAGSGGSGGLVASAGTGSGGSAGLAGSGSSAGLAGSGGSGGLAGSGGSAGLAGSGGSGGSAGSAGLAGSAGSGGLAGSGGSGGSAGSAGGGGPSLDPEYLFTKEDFGGNGRTCVTCHDAGTGTISPAQIEALYAADPDGPLFQPADSDDGASENYAQLRQHATFRATIDLPTGVFLTADPSATSVVFRRGAPSTLNTPALDPVLMWDGRASDLVQQALSAVLGHAEASVTPSAAQLQLIAEFEQGPAFFSNDILRAYDQGGPAPSLPPGGTEAEQRGRRWFAQDPAAPQFNICGQCHGGPMLNATQANSGLGIGKHFQTVNVSELNTLGNPTYKFTFPDPKRPGQTVTVVTPDPGRALVTGDARDANFFKIPTLWGIKRTAPYFHDNSANTLEELMDHYEKHLATFLRRNVSYPTPHVPTAQDKADIIAYLQLL